MERMIEIWGSQIRSLSGQDTVHQTMQLTVSFPNTSNSVTLISTSSIGDVEISTSPTGDVEISTSPIGDVDIMVTLFDRFQTQQMSFVHNSSPSIYCTFFIQTLHSPSFPNCFQCYWSPRKRTVTFTSAFHYFIQLPSANTPVQDFSK